MSPLYLYNGKFLLVDGKLATDQSCCCEECCIKNINCELLVTVTYSNSEIRSNEDDMLDETGSPVSGFKIKNFAGINQDCTNTVYFNHIGMNDGNCTQYATKTQKFYCNICCNDAFFNGCDCSLTDILVEDYTPQANDPGASCSTFNGVYVTNISFSFINCIECPCRACCEYNTTENYTINFSGPEGNFTISGSGPAIGDPNQGLFVAFDCTSFVSCENEIYPALYIFAYIDGGLFKGYIAGIPAAQPPNGWDCNNQKSIKGNTFTLKDCASGDTATITVS